jgi:hypothetical protein
LMRLVQLRRHGQRIVEIGQPCPVNSSAR